MTTLLLTVWTASLLGSLHCLGMCGPFALMAGMPSHGSLSGPATSPAVRGFAWRNIAGYHLGRLLLYSVVGVLFGSMGMAVNLGGNWAGWQSAATYLAGVTMLVVGLIAIGRQLGWRIPLPNFAQSVVKPLQGLLRRTQKLPGINRSIALGILTSLMPCGWLYVFAITAAGVASPLGGALVMIVFWSGTVPVLVLSVVGMGELSRRLPFNVHLATGVLVVAIGMFTLFYRAPVQLTAPIAASANLTDQVANIQQVDHHQLPCCCGGATPAETEANRHTVAQQ